MKKVVTVISAMVALVGTSLLVSGCGAAGGGLFQRTSTPTPMAPVSIASESLLADARVVPAHSAALSMAGGGIVAQVLVAEGERVDTGQVLVKLDAEHLAHAVAEAEANLKTAEAQLARAQVGPMKEDIAAAEAAIEVARSGVQTAEGAVSAAQANLARAQVGPTAESVAIAQARLRQAQAGPTAESVAIAAHGIEVAKNALWGAQALRDGICGAKGYGVPGADCGSAKAAVQRAEEEVRIAELQWQQAKAGPSSEDVAVAAAQLQQAKAGPSKEDIAVAQAQLQQASGQLATAQAQVKQAEASLARARKGPTAEDVAVVSAQVEQARVGVERARSALGDGELRAPFAGTIVSLSAKAGEYLAGGQVLVRLADLGNWQIETTDLTELGVVNVREGDPVAVTFDALPDLQLSGKVATIRGYGEDRQGDIVYTVVIAPDRQDERLRWNMTAKVSIAARK